MYPLFENTNKYLSPRDGLFWFTWSEFYKQELLEHSKELSRVPIFLNNIYPNRPYGYSYDVVNINEVSTGLKSLVENITQQIYTIDNKYDAFLLCDLLFEQFDKNSLSALISLISRYFRENYKNINSFHSPVKELRYDKGFPVHADLFGPQALLNIMTNFKGDDNGGDILLIKKEDVIDSLNVVDGVSMKMRENIACLLDNRYSRDCFDLCYEMLHGKHPWHEELKLELGKRTIVIKNKIGHGYFVVDGKWLHGRTKINGCVPRDRFQRLIFDTKKTLAKPVSNSYYSVIDQEFGGMKKSLDKKQYQQKSHKSLYNYI